MELTHKELEQTRQALRDRIDLRERHLKHVKPAPDELTTKRRQVKMRRELPYAKSALVAIMREITRLKKEVL